MSALAARLAAAEAELEQLRAAAAPKEEPKTTRVIPRIAEGFEELVADLPNAVKRDVDRARHRAPLRGRQDHDQSS